MDGLWPARSLRLFIYRHVNARVVAAVALLCGAALLRFASLEHFGPLYDEAITRAVAQHIWTGDLRNNWKYADVPPDHKRDLFNFSSYLYADALVVGPHPENPIRRERAFSAALGTVALLFFYLAAMELFSPGIALGALAIGAVFPLLVQDSHYARPESFVLALTGLTYWLSLRILRREHVKAYLIAAAFCCGLLLACKVSLLLICFVTLVCLWRAGQFRLQYALLWAGCVLAGSFAGMPGAFLDPQAFLRGLAFLRHEYANELLPHSLTDSPYCYRLLFPYFWQTGGALFCLFTAAGAFALAWRRRVLRSLLLTVPVVFYLLYFGWQRTFFERNLSHVVPLAAMLCAAGVAWIAKSIRWPRLAPLLLCLVLIQPLAVSIKLVFTAMRTTSEERAREYERQLEAREHAPVVSSGDLHTPKALGSVVEAAAQATGPFILRAHDFNDPYTERGFHRLQQLLTVREIGRFPSLFDGFAPSTLYVYHSAALRYILVKPSLRAAKATAE